MCLGTEEACGVSSKADEANLQRIAAIASKSFEFELEHLPSDDDGQKRHVCRRSHFKY